MNRDNFSWSNADDDKAAVVDYVMSATGTRGEIAKNNPFGIEGRDFGTVRSAIKVTVIKTVDGADYAAACRQTTILAADPS